MQPRDEDGWSKEDHTLRLISQTGKKVRQYPLKSVIAGVH